MPESLIKSSLIVGRIFPRRLWENQIAARTIGGIHGFTREEKIADLTRESTDGLRNNFKSTFYLRYLISMKLA